MSRGWLQRLPNGGYDPPLECPTPTSEKNTPSKLDFSHLAAYHIASVRRSTKPLATFCGSVSRNDPQKVLWKIGVVLRAAFQAKLREGSQNPHHHGRQGVSTSISTYSAAG